MRHRLVIYNIETKEPIAFRVMVGPNSERFCYRLGDDLAVAGTYYRVERVWF
jgi:hypothetical protein